jgi:putative transposase
VKAKVLGRKVLNEIGCLFTPDTLLRCHRELIARKWDDSDRMTQIARNLIDLEDGFLSGKQYVLMDRDGKFCPAFRAILTSSGVESVLLLPRSPSLNAHIERFHRSLSEELLDRIVFFGEASLRNAVREYLLHFHAERNHQGLTNRIPMPGDEMRRMAGKVQCRERLGGLLRYYHRIAA